MDDYKGDSSVQQLAEERRHLIFFFYPQFATNIFNTCSLTLLFSFRMEHMVDGLKSNDSEANVILFSAHLIISSISPSIL